MVVSDNTDAQYNVQQRRPTMSNSVLVRWMDSTGTVLFDTVDDLKDEAEVKDLR